MPSLGHLTPFSSYIPMSRSNDKNQDPQPNLPGIQISNSALPQQRPLTTAELTRLQQQIKLEQQRSLFQLAKRTVIAYFSVFVLLSILLLISSLENIDTTDFKWLITRFLEMTSPLVTAVVFYYFGNSKN